MGRFLGIDGLVSGALKGYFEQRIVGYMESGIQAYDITEVRLLTELLPAILLPNEHLIEWTPVRRRPDRDRQLRCHAYCEEHGNQKYSPTERHASLSYQ